AVSGRELDPTRSRDTRRIDVDLERAADDPLLAGGDVELEQRRRIGRRRADEGDARAGRGDRVRADRRPPLADPRQLAGGGIEQPELVDRSTGDRADDPPVVEERVAPPRELPGREADLGLLEPRQRLALAVEVPPAGAIGE